MQHYYNIVIIGELPLTIDFSPFDRDPGDHTITVVAKSTLGDMADSTNPFSVPGVLVTSL